MRPFRFAPILKSLIWGGDKIAAYKRARTDLPNIGESWELSGVQGSESVVVGGEYAGYTLSQLIGELKGTLVGASVYERFGTEFPLLVKFIDARDDLSIQVHMPVNMKAGVWERRRCGMSSVPTGAPILNRGFRGNLRPKNTNAAWQTIR